jgi:hypothetical protein
LIYPKASMLVDAFETTILVDAVLMPTLFNKVLERVKKKYES